MGESSVSPSSGPVIDMPLRYAQRSTVRRKRGRLPNRRWWGLFIQMFSGLARAAAVAAPSAFVTRTQRVNIGTAIAIFAKNLLSRFLPRFFGRKPTTTP